MVESVHRVVVASSWKARPPGVLVEAPPATPSSKHKQHTPTHPPTAASPKFQISNQTFTYYYFPNSNLLATVTGPIHTVINQWEPTRDVLDIKQNKIGTSDVFKYDYVVNELG